jgi:hypothetical protein
MTGRTLTFVLAAGLAACSASAPTATETPAPHDFTGRFINVWGNQNVAEISTARVRNGSQVVTEVLVPRSPGALVENGVDAVAISFRIEIECRPTSYDLVHQTIYAADGRVLSSRPTTGAKFAPRGPYSDLADELCAGDPPPQNDFTSLDDFRRQAAARPGGPIRSTGGPSIVRAED